MFAERRYILGRTEMGKEVLDEEACKCAWKIQNDWWLLYFPWLTSYKGQLKGKVRLLSIREQNETKYE